MIEISSLDRISNHLFVSKIFQSFTHFLSESTIFSNLNDSLDIESKTHWTLHTNQSFIHQHSLSKSFFLLENRSKNIFIDHNKSIFLSYYKDNLNIRIRKSIKSSIKSSILTISYQYWNHFSFSRTSQNHIDFIIKRSCFFRLDVELNIVSSKTTRIFKHINIRIISFFREIFKNTSNCLANWSFFSTFMMTSILDRLEIFNLTFFYDWFENELFNQIANFLQHFQQCLHLYCESKLLDLLIIVSVDFVNAWFDDQSKFISLHDFNIVLTKTFSFDKFVMIQSILISSKLFISLISSSSQKQQKLKIKYEISKFKKVSKTKQIVKLTSTFQNIDIFDSTLTSDEFEFDLYKKVASFLQHFQQCQHLYRKSDLLNLLSKCLCDFAFERFKIQFEFISLKRFNKILTKAFSKTSLRRVSSRSSNLQINTLDDISESMKNASNQQIVQMNCKICKQNFNFNEKLYEHIRKHEVLKFVKNSFLSINAINLVCEIEKKSFASQKSHDLLTKSQKSIFEFAITFETITLLKRSTLQFLALEITSQSTKKLSTCRHCKQTFKFKELLRKHKREQHAKKFVINSSFRSHAFKSICKTKEKSTIKNVTTLFASHELRISNQKIDVQKHSIVNLLFLIDTIKSTCKVAKKSTIASIAKFSKSTSKKKQNLEFELLICLLNWKHFV